MPSVQNVPLRICNKCGWAHFPQSYEDLKQNAENFIAFYNRLSEKDKELYGKRERTVDGMIESSSKCFHCGNDYTKFHNETERDHVPIGCTIQGIRYDGD